MHRTGRISYLWTDDEVAEGYLTGVSLHSHTNHSEETLDFLAALGRRVSAIQALMSQMELRAQRRHQVTVDYAKAYWTPPLTPKRAFDLEGGQIARLGLLPMVSITDHDSITAPLLLRATSAAQHTPVSVEWSVPFGGDQSFHLGIHNLPAETAQSWMQVFAELTAHGGTAGRVTEILASLDAIPDVLIVFNHPMWDLYMVGAARHQELLREFMTGNGRYVHALELNGLRCWKENRAVRAMAQQYGQLLISGGDRHGLEPNAVINLTNASCFAGFVDEIRRARRSHVLFMPQYAEPIKHRILQSTLDAIREHPDFALGSRRWDERVYHRNPDGVPVQLSALWGNGNPPQFITAILAAVKMLGWRPFSSGLRAAWSESRERELGLGERGTAGYAVRAGSAMHGSYPV